MRAVIYTRLSLDREGETSTERQEADCRAYAQSRGWEVLSVYRDRLSGYKDVHRPDYERFIGDLRSGAADVGVVWKLDRLTRKGVRDIAPLLEALEAGGTALASVNDAVDTSSAMGEGVLALLASIAKQESQNISLRTRSAKSRAARMGAPSMGGPRRFGFEADQVTVREDEAALLRDAARRILAGESLRSVAIEWGARGIMTPGGKAWQPSVLSRVLLSPRLRGLRQHGGELYPAQWPAILDEETAAGLELVLGARVGQRRTARSWLLSGIVFCGDCGERLITHRRAKSEGGAREYTCAVLPGLRNKGGVRASADRLEELVEAVVLSAMEHLDVQAIGAREDLRPLFEEQATLRTRLEALEAAYYVEGALSKGRFEELRDAVRDRAERVEEKIREAAGPPVMVSTSAAWEELDTEQRAGIVKALFPRVIVKPAPAEGRRNRFRAERVELVDREGCSWTFVPGDDDHALTLWHEDGRRYLPLS